MKKNFLKRLFILTLVLSLCTTTVLSGTLAKYTSTESGTATVTAAQFLLTADNLSASDTITLTETYDDLYGTGVTLYPGQSGFFMLDASFISDVDATITTTSKATITAIYEDGKDVGTEITATANDALLEDTALRFYIVDSTDVTGTGASNAVQVVDLATAVSTETIVAVDFSDIASTIGTKLITGSTATSTEDDFDYVLNYDASEKNTAAISSSFYVYWVWEYEVSAYDTYGVTTGTAGNNDTSYTNGGYVGDGDTYYNYKEGIYTEDEVLALLVANGVYDTYGEITTNTAGSEDVTYEISGEYVGDGDTYYIYGGKNYTLDEVLDELVASYDAADTEWGNAITNDIASYLTLNDTDTEDGDLSNENNSSGYAEMTGYDIVFDIAVTATQVETAHTT